ncbi:MAG: class III poly(R)-hydroxyalkanoic acid synthase subunit PhaC [Spirosomaceae bacterium]|jgi:polyhydroxyalkanoate synthase|nr:class III poly(R)-hydroxyalkanoic acid synthase subunit PhaC [Spirosomataceae bacterium]
MNTVERNIHSYLKKSVGVAKGVQALADIEVDLATTPRELVMQVGKTKLYHFTNDNLKVKTPILISYALVNTWKMMDLQDDRSLIKKLLSEGLDVYLIETGHPSRADRFKTIDDYVNGDINDCVDFVREETGHDAINLLGVCQGGTLGMIYSALYPQKIKNIVLLVTPVDFFVEDGLLFKWSRDMDIDKLVDNFDGVVPGKFLDSGFVLLKPMGPVRKQMGLPSLMEQPHTFQNFLRMEKWVNDTPDQAGELYRQFIKDLYQNNKLINGEMKVGDKVVDLKNIKCPVMNIYAREDHIVPPSATKPINDAIGSEDSTLYEFPGGHIGVFVGARSQKELGPSIVSWLAERDA